MQKRTRWFQFSRAFFAFFTTLDHFVYTEKAGRFTRPFRKRAAASVLERYIGLTHPCLLLSGCYRGQFSLKAGRLLLHCLLSPVPQSVLLLLHCSLNGSYIPFWRLGLACSSTAITCSFLHQLYIYLQNNNSIYVFLVHTCSLFFSFWKWGYLQRVDRPTRFPLSSVSTDFSSRVLVSFLYCHRFGGDLRSRNILLQS